MKFVPHRNLILGVLKNLECLLLVYCELKSKKTVPLNESFNTEAQINCSLVLKGY